MSTSLLRPPDWTKAAACIDQNPSWWDDDGTPRARTICATCPVQLDCARYALDNAIPTGMFGGLDPTDRRRAAPRHGYDRPGAARHGDRSRYNTCTAGPDGGKCAPCRESMRRWKRDYVAATGRRPLDRSASA
jgi:WhiB family redox-sensing transcriptional regulator